MPFLSKDNGQENAQIFVCMILISKLNTKMKSNLSSEPYNKHLYPQIIY
jgi:hypothetical protein